MTIMISKALKSSIPWLPAPTEDNHRAVEGMKRLAFFSDVKSEVADIILANANKGFQKNIMEGDGETTSMLGRN